jgi:hypothetical protein
MVFEPLIDHWHLTWMFMIIIPLALLLVFFKSNSNTNPPRNKPSSPPQNTRIVHLRGGAGEPDDRLSPDSSAVHRRHQNQNPDLTSHSETPTAPLAHVSTPQARVPTQNHSHPIPLSRRRLSIDMHIDLLKAQRNINTTLKREIAASKANAKQKQNLNARSLANPDLATVGEKQDPPGSAFPQPSTCTHQQQDASHKENCLSRIPYQPPSPPSRLSDYPAAFRGRFIDNEYNPGPTIIPPPSAPSPPRVHHQPEIAKQIDTMMLQQRDQHTNWVHVDIPFEQSADVHGSGSGLGSASASVLAEDFDGTDGGADKKLDNNNSDSANHTFNPNPSEPEPNSPSDSSWTEAHFTSSIELLEREIFYPTVPCSTSRLIPLSSSSYLAAEAELAAGQEDAISAYAHRYDAEHELLIYGSDLKPSPMCTGRPEPNSKGSSVGPEPAAADEEQEDEEGEEIQAYARRYDAERGLLKSELGLNRSKPKSLDE